MFYSIIFRIYDDTKRYTTSTQVLIVRPPIHQYPEKTCKNKKNIELAGTSYLKDAKTKKELKRAK